MFIMQTELYGLGVQCLKTVYNVGYSICISEFMGLVGCYHLQISLCVFIFHTVYVVH